MASTDTDRVVGKEDLRLQETGFTWGIVWQLFIAPERKRLAAALAVERARFASLHKAKASGEAWAGSALELYAEAEAQMRSGDLDSGWKLLHEAQRTSIPGLSAAELEAEITVVIREAESKLFSWRKESVCELLSRLEKASSVDERRAALGAAVRVRDEHSDNVYFRNRLLRRQMGLVAGLLLALLIAFFTTLHYWPTIRALPKPDEALSIPVLLVGVMLGGVGACLSALLTFATSSPQLKIPEHLANVAVTLTRPLIGGVSGLVAMLLLHAGVIQFGSVSLIVPIAFGFSERLVVGALGSLGEKK